MLQGYWSVECVCGQMRVSVACAVYVWSCVWCNFDDHSQSEDVLGSRTLWNCLFRCSICLKVRGCAVNFQICLGVLYYYKIMFPRMCNILLMCIMSPRVTQEMCETYFQTSSCNTLVFVRITSSILAWRLIVSWISSVRSMIIHYLIFGSHFSIIVFWTNTSISHTSTYYFVLLYNYPHHKNGTLLVPFVVYSWENYVIMLRTTFIFLRKCIFLSFPHYGILFNVIFNHQSCKLLLFWRCYFVCR